jgi:putative FmdB family regulatory protein
MPIYEYACLDCGAQFDALRSMREADQPIACQACESDHVSRMISVFFARSGGRSVAGTSGGCARCSGDMCSTCGS